MIELLCADLYFGLVVGCCADLLCWFCFAVLVVKLFTSGTACLFCFCGCGSVVFFVCCGCFDLCVLVCVFLCGFGVCVFCGFFWFAG